MANTAIVESILLISSIIISAALSATIISKYGILQSTLGNALDNERRNAIVRLEAVHSICISQSEFDVFIKNIGKYPADLSEVNILIGPPGSETPVWNNSNGLIILDGDVNGTILPQGALGIIKIKLNENLTTATVSIKLIYPNGITDRSVCSLG